MSVKAVVAQFTVKVYSDGTCSVEAGAPEGTKMLRVGDALATPAHGQRGESRQWASPVDSAGREAALARLPASTFLKACGVVRYKSLLAIHDHERIKEVCLAAIAKAPRLKNMGGWVLAALVEKWDVAPVVDVDAGGVDPLVYIMKHCSPRVGRCSDEHAGQDQVQ